MKKINIVIVDDHDLFRDGLKLVLSQIENFNVIFDTDSGFLFLDFLKTRKPDIVLMDIDMPEINGFETTKKALDLYPSLNIISLSMFSDTINYTQMISAGVKGFVLKKANKTELQQAINKVYSGGNYFSQEILQKLAFNSLLPGGKNESLTIREIEILNLVCSGLTSHEIAEKLFISIKTVETHRTNIFQKAQVRNTAELLIWAVKNNFFSIK
ncbi:MAG: response regulator transcription factor [Chlorobi bacterium]|nr:response regulator transcription factor [Chlorobiota bacterium]